MDTRKEQLAPRLQEQTSAGSRTPLGTANEKRNEKKLKHITGIGKTRGQPLDREVEKIPTKRRKKCAQSQRESKKVQRGYNEGTKVTGNGKNGTKSRLDVTCRRSRA